VRQEEAKETSELKRFEKEKRYNKEEQIEKNNNDIQKIELEATVCKI